MRFLIRNLHVFVFALFSIYAAVWVATEPERAAGFVRPMVEDAVELKDMANGAYSDLRNFNWKSAYDEFLTLYIAAMRMPSLVFERLADRLDDVAEDLSKRAQTDLPTTASGEPFRYAGQHHADASATAMP